MALNDSKASSQTTIHENVTVPCPALQDVVRRDGTFNIIYWSICTSRRCDQQDTKWDWIGGMNNKGLTQVGREGVNITRDGALEIQEVNPSDSGQYMCTVKPINHASPEVYKTTLLIKDGKSGSWLVCPYLFKIVIRIGLLEYNSFRQVSTSDSIHDF